MAKPKYARVGEQVQIVTPKRFLRCGYPLTRNIVAVKFRNEIEDRRIKAVEVIRGYKHEQGVGWIDSGPPSLGDKVADQKLVDAICFYILQREGFGGKERQIFEETVDENAFEYGYIYPGKLGTVIARKTILTGKYYPPWSGQNYEGEWDYEPGGLEGSKAHCVYTLDLGAIEFMTLATNCERISVQNLDSESTISEGGTNAQEESENHEGTEAESRELQTHSADGR